jgi:hypothetical protein
VIPRDAEGREELGTDLCLCGHLRDQHIGLGHLQLAEDCLGGPDDLPCDCDSFERDG